MTKYTWMLGGVVAIVLSIALGMVAAHKEREKGRAPYVAQVEKLRDYCATVSVALAMDAKDLESDDPQRRLEAANRFGNLVTYHSEQEILLCSAPPPVLLERDQCWFAKDYACLARLAKVAAATTKPR